MQITFIIAALAFFGIVMAGPAPSVMGVEVIEENGQTIVREVVSFSDRLTPVNVANLIPGSLWIERAISSVHQLRPRLHDISSTTTTSKFYKGIAPLEDQSVVFLSHIVISNSSRAAETQAIWSIAYFDDKVTMPSLEQAQKDIT
ncbi:hypothetical protein ACMFMG_002797 [Clarireedia jacksonii]